MSEKKKNSKTLQVLMIVFIVILAVVVGLDVLSNWVDLKSIFSQTVQYKTEKEVTVTDKGIADAVDKIYDATVIVEIGDGKQLTGWGSGVVYKTDEKYGYILTNHHVVEGAKAITVVYTDESTTDGEVVGSDEIADIAVVKVPVSTVKAIAEIGSSDDLKTGDTVFAVGTPIDLAYSFTVTRGILSGKDRMVEMTSSSSSSSSSSNDYSQYGWPFGYGNGNYSTTPTQTATSSWYMRLLQIDASINSGNSGGPLANSNGELVGITNSKLSSGSTSSSSSATIENIGFAIPIEDAISIADELMESGSITRPVLGVSMCDIEGASANGVTISDDIKKGAVVVSVSDNSTASAAGLKSGDVITKLGDYEIDDYQHLKYYLYRYRVGDKVDLTFTRDGKTKTVTLNLKG